MTVHFQAAIKQLYLSLSLPAPSTIDPITSLQFDRHVCHLTEHPVGYLLMFVNVTPAEHAPVEEQNLFSQDTCKPVLGLDSVSQDRVLWNRQPLLQMDRAMVYHQLEQLVCAARQLSNIA
ncbi:Tir chaperone family protein CesT [Pseudomonas baetica]|uniref:Tir chaperone family protein CesT n=1 Tax=Pseudomonas baetica TaxID=674054 RepID=A0ABX4PQJ9_9PSED|nr:CesT family type III secretion system chaperone [Pseudomonas baetica]PKA67317.1 Tir chaperone family protein CesT [Pseudomonas baetica]PTC18748.1 Tir chaperone family protein [Pseudomonas baetica]